MRFFYKRDKYIIILMLIIAAAVYAVGNSRSAQPEAEIICDGTVVATVSLDTAQTFSLPQNQNVVFDIKDNAICFLSSDCPDKTCVNTGYIKQAGRYAACLPNKFAIRIIPSGEGASDEPDVLAGR